MHHSFPLPRSIKRAFYLCKNALAGFVFCVLSIPLRKSAFAHSWVQLGDQQVCRFHFGRSRMIGFYFGLGQDDVQINIMQIPLSLSDYFVQSTKSVLMFNEETVKRRNLNHCNSNSGTCIDAQSCCQREWERENLIEWVSLACLGMLGASVDQSNNKIVLTSLSWTWKFVEFVTTNLYTQ